MGEFRFLKLYSPPPNLSTTDELLLKAQMSFHILDYGGKPQRKYEVIGVIFRLF